MLTPPTLTGLGKLATGEIDVKLSGKLEVVSLLLSNLSNDRIVIVSNYTKVSTIGTA